MKKRELKSARICWETGWIFFDISPRIIIYITPNTGLFLNASEISHQILSVNDVINTLLMLMLYMYTCKKKKKKTQSQLFMLVGEYTYETCLNIVYLYVKIGRNLLLMSYIWTKYTRLDRQKLCQIYHNGARCLINLAHLSGHVICFFFSLCHLSNGAHL